MLNVVYGFLTGAAAATVLCAMFGRLVVTKATNELVALRTDLKAILAYLNSKV